MSAPNDREGDPPQRQVTRAVLGEAAGVGVVGSTLGLAVGLRALFKASGADLGGGPTFTCKPVLWSYVVGVTVTVVAAYFPARRAAKIPPVAAMRGDVEHPHAHAGRLPGAGGADRRARRAVAGVAGVPPRRAPGDRVRVARRLLRGAGPRSGAPPTRPVHAPGRDRSSGSGVPEPRPLPHPGRRLPRETPPARVRGPAEPPPRDAGADRAGWPALARRGSAGPGRPGRS